MKHQLRSAATTTGRRMAGARSLWRANGMTKEQMGMPIIGIANSFTQMVPGHVHLHEIGQYVKQLIEAEGCFAAEFNTIAIDDGIAMGHDGMLYSLPSRDIIADSVEYMANAHKVDALVCISNCDKITPGMLMAAMRLNIPTIFVSGGPMEAGSFRGRGVDLIDAMVMSADASCTDADADMIEATACPGCGSCSGMFTANSMNCLNEAIGLALPGNGTVVATHENRKGLFARAAKLIVENAKRYYFEGDDSVLPRSIATKAAFENAMSLDIAMGGSTNTVLHLLAIAHEAGVDFTMKDIDRLSRKIPVLCKVAPNGSYHVQDVNRAGGIMGILGVLADAGLIDTTVGRVDSPSLAATLDKYYFASPSFSDEARKTYLSAAAGRYSRQMASQAEYYDSMDDNHATGCIRDMEHAYFKDGGLAVLFGNIARKGCIVKTAGVDPALFRFSGKAKVFESQEQAMNGILNDEVKAGDGVVIHAGDALPHVVPQVEASGQGLRPDYRRTLLGRHVGPLDRARITRSGFGRRDRHHPRRRHDRHRHTGTLDIAAHIGRGARLASGRMARPSSPQPRPRGAALAQGILAAGKLGRSGRRKNSPRRVTIAIGRYIQQEKTRYRYDIRFQ